MDTTPPPTTETLTFRVSLWSESGSPVIEIGPFPTLARAIMEARIRLMRPNTATIPGDFPQTATVVGRQAVLAAVVRVGMSNALHISYNT